MGGGAAAHTSSRRDATRPTWAASTAAWGARQAAGGGLAKLGVLREGWRCPVYPWMVGDREQLGDSRLTHRRSRWRRSAFQSGESEPHTQRHGGRGGGGADAGPPDRGSRQTRPRGEPTRFLANTRWAIELYVLYQHAHAHCVRFDVPPTNDGFTCMLFTVGSCASGDATSFAWPTSAPVSRCSPSSLPVALCCIRWCIEHCLAEAVCQPWGRTSSV